MQISDSYDNVISLDGGCNRTKIIDCRFNDCSQTPTNGAIYLGFGYGYEEYNVVQDCIINGSGQNGIYWSEAPYGLISDNSITYWSRVAAGAGISIRGSNSIVTGNQISNGIGSTYGGIADAPSGSSSGPAYNVTVSNNTIYSSGGNGITVFGNKWLITGNTIYNCPRRGIQLCGECKAAIEDNYIRNCVGYGIAIYQSSFNNIVSNNITGGYNDGIEMWDSGTPCLNNTILDNSITNNSGYGIYEADLSNYSRIIGNILTTNALGALSLSGTYDTVENNVGS